MQGMHKHIHVHFTSIFTSVSPYMKNHEIISISIIQILYHKLLVFPLILYVYSSSPIMRSLAPIVLNIFLIELIPLLITNLLSPPLSPPLAEMFFLILSVSNTPHRPLLSPLPLSWSNLLPQLRLLHPMPAESTESLFLCVKISLLHLRHETPTPPTPHSGIATRKCL